MKEEKASFANLYEDFNEKASVGFRNLNELVVRLASPIDRLDATVESNIGNWLEIINTFLAYQAKYRYNGKYRDEVIHMARSLQEIKLPKETCSRWLVALLSLKWFFAGAAKALSNHDANSSSVSAGKDASSIKNLWICSRDAKWLILKLAIDLDRIYGSVKIDDKPLEKSESSLHISELTEVLSSFAKRGFLDFANDEVYIEGIVEKELMNLIRQLYPRTR